MDKGFRFDPGPHEYSFNGTPVPGITKILKPIQPHGFYTLAARDRGSIIHRAISEDDGSELPMLDGEPAPSDIASHMESFRNFVSDHGFESIINEKPLYHKTLKYAGTPDRYGFMRGDTPVVFEIKTGPHHASYEVQTAAQAALIGANGYREPKLRFSLILRPDGTYEIKVHNSHSDFGMFRSLLNIYRWCKIHNVNYGGIS